MTVFYKQTAIHFEVFGEGDTLVLLHGFLEDSRIWKPFIPEFSKKHQVVAIDLFGHGKTGKVDEIHTMEEMAEAVSEVLDSLDKHSAIIMGHSMGGYVALAFTELFQEKTNSVILLNSTSKADSEARKKERDRSINLVEQNKNGFIRMAIGNLFTAKSREIFQKEVENLILNAQKLPAENIVASINGMKNRKDRSSILKGFERRKVWFAGKEDPIISFDESTKTAEITECQLVPLPGSHMGFLENRELILAETKKIIGLS
ncbi:MAG TPA: alpha/beta hydrolase [Flavobacteriaceae bacterium]|nr:alpha/beta hydrolase [Flavobacteriaceae bacterium]